MATLLTPAAPAENLTLLESPEAVSPSRRLHHHLLTIEPTPLLAHEHARVFRAANYTMRSVRSWHHAVEWVARGELDVVLLDADAIEANVSALNVSTRRVVTLLRRAARGRPLIIAVVSARDFVEIEDVVRAGVDVPSGLGGLLDSAHRGRAAAARHARRSRAQRLTWQTGIIHWRKNGLGQR